MTRLAFLPIVLCLVAGSARADDIYANPNDPGRVTAIDKGVWEIDLGALGILASDHQGESTVTRLSTDMSLTVSRFIKNNLSIGIAGLFDYDSSGGGDHVTQFGGAVQATFHVRLGLGAFFRPGLSIGAVFGNHDTPITAGTVETDSQFGMIARLQLPLAYFTSRRLVLQAGPQLNFTVGSNTPMGGSSSSFSRIAGGFAVGAGYAF